MKNNEIADLLNANHARFVHQLKGLREDELYHSPQGKWNAVQHLDHIVKSVSAVTFAFSVPKFIVAWKFGKSNRPSKTYDGLVDKYKQKLLDGYPSSGRFSAGDVTSVQKEKLLARLTSQVSKLSRKVSMIDDAALDTYILPHPLLGKLTFREMLYFTAYHVNHHAALVEKGLERYQPAAS